MTIPDPDNLPVDPDDHEHRPVPDGDQPDPRDTEHPAGEDHAKQNIENEPPG